MMLTLLRLGLENLDLIAMPRLDRMLLRVVTAPSFVNLPLERTCLQRLFVKFWQLVACAHRPPGTAEVAYSAL